MRRRREWPEHSHGWRLGHTALQVPLSKLLNCFLLYKHHRVCVTIVDYYRHKVRLKHGVKSCAHPVHTSHQETVWWSSQILGSISKRTRLIFFVRESEVWAQRYRWQLLNKLNKYLVRCRVVFQPGNLGRPWSLLCPRAGSFGWGHRPSCRKRCPPSEDRRQHPPAHWEDSLYTCPYRCVFAVRILGRRGID